MSPEKKEAHVNGEERDKLCMATGHAIAFAEHFDSLRPFFLDQALQAEVQYFTTKLAGESKEEFDFAGAVDEGDVDNAKALREEG